MKRTIGMAFMLTLSLAIFSSFAARSEDGVVAFCFNEWPPYAQMVDGKPGGISVEILREAAVRAGLRPAFVELPWNRCLQNVRDGLTDAVIDAATREEFLQGPSSFSVYTNTFWVRADDPVQVFDVTALRDHRIGLVDGYIYPEDLSAMLRPPAYQVEFSVDDSVNVRKLAFRRVDAIIGDYIATTLLARENGYSLRALQPPHSFDRLYPSFNKDRAGLQERIDAALAAMLEEGFVDRLYRSRFNISLYELTEPAAAIR